MAPPSQFGKTILSPGNNVDFPKSGDEVAIAYTGWFWDESKPNNRGRQFDSSTGRGDFRTQIGVGKVIPGWDHGVPKMSLGERSILTIPVHMAYGARGFPGVIPPDATLIFDVHLKSINKKSI